MKKSIRKLGLSTLAAAAALATATTASALVIDPAVNTADCTGVGTGNDSNFISNSCEQMSDLTQIYKQEVGGGESGDLAASYTTTFSNTSTDPMDALIVYEAPGNIPNFDGSVWLIVKDGNQDPGRYAYDLGALGWDGIETLELKNFWPDSGAISQVALYGGSSNPLIPPIVPPTYNGSEPTTLLLVGLGLLGFGLNRRKRA